MDPVFRLKCSHCGATSEIPESLGPSESLIPRHFCSDCGFPRNDEVDYFLAFGVPRKFRQDLALLEKRFYEVSRGLHPDRFTLAGSEAKALSLSRMSFLNQAYSTLKNGNLRRQYLLSLEGVKGVSSDSNQKRSPAFQPIVERWFDLQESFADDPGSESVKESLNALEKDVKDLEAAAEEKIALLEKNYDLLDLSSRSESPSENPILKEIAEVMNSQSYLKSLSRDLVRFRHLKGTR